MLFEIVNPSDTATLEAVDFEVACCACLLLGEGTYGLREVGGVREMPILAFFPGDANTWFSGQFGRTVEAALNAIWKDSALSACLESVLLGNADDRDVYRTAMEAITDEAARKKFKATWHDKHRSSMNDICKAAWSLADRLRAQKVSQGDQEGDTHGK